MTVAVKELIIYTDGGCSGNPGPGGWGAVLRYGTKVKELSGGEPATTNNRMELTAAIHGLTALKVACRITIHTDSEYVKNGITKWIAGWKKNGWKTKDKSPVKNADLWQQLDAACIGHAIEWRWVKGHAGVPDNERCDVLATAAIAAIRRRFTHAELKAAAAKLK